jgi:hypothetical protein
MALERFYPDVSSFVMIWRKTDVGDGDRGHQIVLTRDMIGRHLSNGRITVAPSVTCTSRVKCRHVPHATETRLHREMENWRDGSIQLRYT